MGLSTEVMSFLYKRAEQEGKPQPLPTEDLFDSGVLDSFQVVDLITLLEQQCGIRVPDEDVTPENFRSIERIGEYVASRGGS
jgi:acyl carrier protein